MQINPKSWKLVSEASGLFQNLANFHLIVRQSESKPNDNKGFEVASGKGVFFKSTDDKKLWVYNPNHNPADYYFEVD